jgi:hypothetical protein
MSYTSQTTIMSTNCMYDIIHHHECFLSVAQLGYLRDVMLRSSMQGNDVIEHVDGKHHVFVFWYARGRDSCYTVLVNV